LAITKLTILEEDILSLIPQRPPFVMIDRLTGCDDISSRTRFEVKGDNVLVHKGQFTEAGLIENIAQTAAAGVGYIKQQNGSPILTGYIGAIKNLEIFALPGIGDVIDTEVIIENQVFDVTIISGKIKHNDELLAKCEMKIFIKN
jgi:predicted hotdog family 3-hydroxylacyl-ACP dehydratase